MTLSNKSILLVDDNTKLLDGLARTFEENDFQVHKAISTAEAIVILNHNEIDVIISDNQMTGANGTRLLAFVCKSFPRVLRFMLTGDISRSQSIIVEHEIGVCQVFEKPCTSQIILESVVEAMASTAN